ncbi:arginyltransferase [Asaia sp. W19]|uniref:arginyltransferase n=1 Tax=unclassified Asaia TaxID=2685023 RepID=UPI000F8EF076|nr:arginyltransferase [Asaia sp. W19]
MSAHRPQLFYTTEPSPCPYLPGRTERKVMTELSGVDADQLHDRLSRAGFRRSHGIVYAPVCSNCQSCIPIRLPVFAFRPDRTMRRVRRDHADLVVTERPIIATEEQYELFRAYQEHRHGDGDMALMGLDDYQSMIETSPVETSVFEFRTREGRLVCVSLVDMLSDGLSAVYTFYCLDDPHRSFGTASILWLIAEAASRGKPYLYLGYWVPGSAKMGYKSRFQAAEILRAGQWHRLADQLGAKASPLPGSTAPGAPKFDPLTAMQPAPDQSPDGAALPDNAASEPI